jgi:hypothetical protein
MEIVESKAQAIIAAHNEAREHGGKAIEAAVKCGTLLIEQMKSTPKGGFTDWIEANCPNICRRTAYNYMTLAKRVQHVAHLDSKGLRQAYIAAGILKEQPKEVHDPSEDMDAMLDLAGILGTKWMQWDKMFERTLPTASDQWLVEQAELLRGPHDRYEQIKARLKQ